MFSDPLCYVSHAWFEHSRLEKEWSDLRGSGTSRELFPLLALSLINLDVTDLRDELYFKQNLQETFPLRCRYRVDLGFEVG